MLKSLLELESSAMRVDINHKKRYIDIWVRHDEPPVDVRGYVKLYPRYSINVLRSGCQDLTALTMELLRNNR